MYYNLRKRKKREVKKLFREDRFREALRKKGLTIKDVATHLKINTSTLYRKMVGESDFYRSEIQAICSLLDIEDPSKIFFA